MGNGMSHVQHFPESFGLVLILFHHVAFHLDATGHHLVYTLLDCVLSYHLHNTGISYQVALDDLCHAFCKDVCW